MSAFQERAARTGIPYFEDDRSYKRFETGFSTAAMGFPDHPEDVQVYIGMFTWLGALIDDTISEIVNDVENFQGRFYSGETQPTPLLETYAALLRSTYNYFDPISANFIILSALAFLNSCVLETRDEYKNLATTKGGERWPYYFRDKEGIPEAYAYFMFPKALYPDMSAFLEAIPDMGIFINLINDVLSFYKEELAGETRNYIHKRAKYEEETPLEVLESVIVETESAFRKSCAVLQGRDPYDQAWHTFVMGFIAMHKSQARYRLWEIGLGDDNA